MNQSDKSGIEYSSLAEKSLILGQVISALALILGIIKGIHSLFIGEWLFGLVVLPMGCIFYLAMFFVFGRVRKM